MPKTVIKARRNKKATIHPLAVKLAAIKRINILVASGTSRFSAQKTLARELKVTTQTVVNWFNKHNTSLTQINSNHVLTPTGKLIIQSLNVRTIDGANVRLTPEDVKGIAEYAPLM